MLSDPAPSEVVLKEKLNKAMKRALGGGLAGASAMVIQVSTLSEQVSECDSIVEFMWLISNSIIGVHADADADDHELSVQVWGIL